MPNRRLYHWLNWTENIAKVWVWVAWYRGVLSLYGLHIGTFLMNLDKLDVCVRQFNHLLLFSILLSVLQNIFFANLAIISLIISSRISLGPPYYWGGRLFNETAYLDTGGQHPPHNNSDFLINLNKIDSCVWQINHLLLISILLSMFTAVWLLELTIMAIKFSYM